MDGKPKPKKRGRKPGVKNKPKTEKIEEITHVKKKRGRKPKKIENENKHINYEMNKNYIIRLNTNNIKTIDIKAFSDEIMLNEFKNENNISKVCWNCCHSFHQSVVGIPLKYNNGVFYIYGFCCSLECAARYVCDNFKESDIWEIISLINLYNIKVNKNQIPINIAPSKLILDMFGGDITIEEYRNNFVNPIEYNISIPPIIPISHNSEKIELNTNHKLNENYKLYRKKKPIQEKNNITNSMDLHMN